jgi:hypothetical protein
MKKLGVLAAIATVLVLFAVVRPGVNTPSAEADFTTSGGLTALPSAAPGVPAFGVDQALPAIIPASGPGNHAIITAFFDGYATFDNTVVPPYPLWWDKCREDVLQTQCKMTFEVNHLVLDTGALTATNAKFMANNSSKLVCSDDSTCDVDGLDNGVIAVKLQGGGKDEVLQVTATDQLGDSRTVLVITTQTMQIVPPILEPNTQVIPGLDDIALASYSCGTNVGRSVFDVGGMAIVDTLEEMWLSIYGSASGHWVLIPDDGFAIIPMTSNNPFFRCGGDTGTMVDDSVQFQTDLGMLTVDPLQAAVGLYPFIALGDCDEGDKVSVNDGGIFQVTSLNPPNLMETCDLDAAPNGVVTYALLRTADAVGVATVAGQQGTLGGSSRSAPLNFIGVATYALDLGGIPDTVAVLGAGEAVPIEIIVLSLQGGTGPSPVAGITVSCSLDPANAGFALLPDRDTSDGVGTAHMSLVPTGIPGSKFTITCKLEGHPEVAPVSKEVTVVAPGEQNLEVVDLVEGTCNPIAATWANGTAIAKVAGAVAPPEALDAIWKFDPATGTWQAFSPSAPADVNDLASVDRLDVIFFCVNAAAKVSRPVI